MRIRERLILYFVAAVLFAAIPASAQQINTQIYKIVSNQCGPYNRLLMQTGFRTRVQGEIGLVTALHGVVGCQYYEARRKENNTIIFISDLRLSKVDIEHDLAFLSSALLASDREPPLTGSPTPDFSALKVIAYPLGSDLALDYPVHLSQTPKGRLADLVSGSIEQMLQNRKSPDPQAEVLIVTTTITSGHSGAPIFSPDLKVVGIADGGLAGGFAGVNWAIPFADADWQDAATATGLARLAGADIRVLFSTPEEQSLDTQIRTGAKVSGRVMYNGRPVSEITRAMAVIGLMDVATRKTVPVDIRYDNQNGTFVIAGIPPGKYTPFIRLEEGYPFHLESGGDFFARLSGLNQDWVVPPHLQSMQHDLEVVKIVHLVRPLDNQERRTNTYDGPENLYPSFYAPSADIFQWDPVPGAAGYEVWLQTVEEDTGKRVNLRSERVSTTVWRPNIGISSPATHYSFLVQAYGVSGRLIGVYEHYYKNGSGGWFDFRVVPPPS